MNTSQTNAKYRLSIVVIFYNMRREAARTLFSLTKAYQQNIDDLSYEVIAIDNGSSQPLDQAWVEGFGENFRYIYFDTKVPSPCAALNYGVEVAAGDFVMACIDGARIFSPGILHYAMLAANIYPNPFVYTLGMHLGAKLQNYLFEEGYSQADEDVLIASVDWQKDGYLLFDISNVASSSGKGYFSEIKESNCFMLRRSSYQEIGGFNERFKSAGGGIVNLDFFNRINMLDGIRPVMLLGEATFHQFHGGTATNVALKDHPWKKMQIEYELIYRKSYAPYFVSPTFLGSVHPKCKWLLSPGEES